MVIDTLAACAELVGVPLGGPPAAAPAGFPATIPEDFEVGRAGNRQTTAAHVLEIAAIQAVLEPDTTPGAMVPPYYDKLTGTPGVMDRVNAWRTAQGHGGRFRSGNVNGIMRGVFRLSSTQKNFCTRADCRRVCTLANCGAHYNPGSRTRFTVIEGVCFI